MNIVVTLFDLCLIYVVLYVSIFFFYILFVLMHV